MKGWLALVTLLSVCPVLVDGSDGGGGWEVGFFRSGGGPPPWGRGKGEAAGVVSSHAHTTPNADIQLADGFSGGGGGGATGPTGAAGAAGATGTAGATGPPSHGLAGFNVLVPDGAGTSYAAPGFSGQISMPTAGATDFESRAAAIAPGITLTALRCAAGVLQGSGNTAVITLRKGSTIAGMANSVVTCTMSNALTCTSSASVTLVDPSYIDFSITLTGTSPVGGAYTCSVETA